MGPYSIHKRDMHFVVRAITHENVFRSFMPIIIPNKTSKCYLFITNYLYEVQ